MLLAFSPLFLREVQALTWTPRAARNIAEQQYRMALFLREFYQEQAVAANDVGAINFFAEIDCLDLYGLASLEVARAKLTGQYRRELVERLARRKGVRVAIVYRHWYDTIGGLPESWVEVGSWRILNNIVCGGDTVIFFAVAPGERDRLIACLRAFSPRLPAGVIQSGAYRQ